MEIPTWQDLFAIAGQLRDERNLLIAQRDAAWNALETIAQGIDPYADQLQNWIAGQIDTALDKAQLS